MTEETTEDTHAAKIHQVVTWLLEGNREHLIREAIAETWPDADATPLIVEALQSVAQSAEAMRANAEDWALESLRFIYQKQIEIGEYAAAVGTVKQIQALISKHTPRVIAHTHHFGPITQANFDDVRARIAARIISVSNDAGGPGSPGPAAGRGLPAPAADTAGQDTPDSSQPKPKRGRPPKRKDGAIPGGRTPAAGKRPGKTRKV